MEAWNRVYMYLFSGTDATFMNQRFFSDSLEAVDALNGEEALCILSPHQETDRMCLSPKSRKAQESFLRCCRRYLGSLNEQERTGSIFGMTSSYE